MTQDLRRGVAHALVVLAEDGMRLGWPASGMNPCYNAHIGHTESTQPTASSCEDDQRVHVQTRMHSSRLAAKTHSPSVSLISVLGYGGLQ